MLSLSMFAVFVVPYDENGFPIVNMTSEAMSEIQEENNDQLHLMQLDNMNLARAKPDEKVEMPNVWETIPSGAVDFKDEIYNINFVDEDGNSKETFDAGNAAELLAWLNLQYRFASSSVVNTGQPYIYCQLPEYITIPEDFIGEVKDGGWETDVGKAAGKVAGFYSISKETRLLVIKFTKDYITDKIAPSTSGFEGAVEFEGYIGRDGTASGDREIDFNGHKLTVTFGDMLDENSKNSQIIRDTETGNMVIHYTVTIRNPGEKVNLSEYKLADTKFSDARKISHITPENIGQIVDGAFEFDSNANAVTGDSFNFEYDYTPTAEELASGKIENQASIVNKGNPNDKATSNKKETDIPKDALKASIRKSGRPSYLVNDGELGWIEWTVTVSRDYNGSLKDYVISDNALKAGVIEDSISVTSQGGAVAYHKDSNNNIIIDDETDEVTIVYRTSTDNTGAPLRGQPNSVTVNNTATVTPPPSPNTPPDNPPPPDDSTNSSVNYSEKSSVSKSGEYISIDGYDKLDKPENDIQTLNWTANLTNFNGFKSGDVYTDTLSDGQYYTQEQINAIQVDPPGLGQIVGTDGTGDGKFTGFTFTFSADTNVKRVTLTYQSSVDTISIENGGSKTFKNTGSYDSSTSEGSSTINRGDSGVGPGKQISSGKEWEDDNSGRPDNVYLLLQYRLEDSSEWKDYPEIDGNTNPQKESNWMTWQNVPKSSITGKEYYYRVVEVISENGQYVQQTPDGYQVTYSLNWGDYNVEIGSNSETNFKVKNTRTSFNANVTKTWVDDGGVSHSETITAHLERTTTPDVATSWTQVSGFEEISLSSNNNWSESLQNLPKKDEAGNTYYYRVVEDTKVADYTTVEYSPEYAPASDSLSFTIKNIWDYVNITPQKTWVGDTEATRSGITVKLEQRRKDVNGNWIDTEWQDSGKETKIISKGSSTADPWTNLPKKDEQGNKIYYRAVEVVVPDKYVETYDENGLNATGTSTITNALNTLSIEPAKQWAGDEGHEDQRKPVTFKLMQKVGNGNWENATDKDGNELKTIEISSGSGEKWTAADKWENLPKTKTENGERQYIYYKVVEVTKVDGYTSSESTSTNESGELIVTNTYDNIKISATKTWSGDNSSNRPETITLHLEKFINNEWITVEGSDKTIPIDEVAEKAVWDDLPRADNGTAITYRVVESSVSGYGASYSPETISGQSGTIGITNTKRAVYKKSPLEPGIHVNDTSFADNEKAKTSKLSNEQLANVPKRDVEINGKKESCYIFKWMVEFPGNEKVDYIDTLPEGSVFYIEEWDDNSQVPGKGQLRPAFGNKSMASWEHRDSEKSNYYTYDNDSRQLHIQYNTPHQDGYYFIYFTAIPVEKVDAKIAEDGYYPLTNSIRRSDETEGITAELSIGSNGDAPSDKSVINKNYVKIDKNDEAQAQYEVEINPEGKKLSSEDYLDITDIFEVTGYKQRDGIKQTGQGLLDVVVSSVEVLDLDNLDSQGNPTKLTDYSYTPPSENKEQVEVITDCKNSFSTTINNGSDFTLINSDVISANTEVVLKLKGGNSGESVSLSYAFWSDIGEADGMTFEVIDSVFDADGNARVKIKFAKKIEKLQSQICLIVEGMSFKEAPEVISAESKETKEIINNVMSFQVPDERHLKIVYCYDLKTNENTPGGLPVGSKPPVGSEIYFKNEAAVNTSSGTQKDDTDETSFVVARSGATVTTVKVPSIEKVNVSNHSINNLEATFKLAKYENGNWVYATDFTDESNRYKVTFDENAVENNNIVPTSAASLTISSKHEIDLSSDVLYKLVEITAPEGYKPSPYKENASINSDEMKEFVFYFVYNCNKSQFSEVVDDKNITEISSGGTFSVPNSQLIDISIKKDWEQPPESANVSAAFKLYYSTVRSSTIPAKDKLTSVGEEKTVTFTNNNGKLEQNDKAEWKDLPNGKDGKPIYYYVVEESYTIDGKTYTRQDDNTYKSGDEVGAYKGIYAGNGLSKDGVVEYTNLKGLYVQKEWKNSDNSEMTTPPVDEIKFTLQGKTADGEWKTINLADDQRTLDKTHQWQIEIPADKLTGYVDFKVTEELTQEQSSGKLYGYVVSYTKNLNGTSGVLEISNKNPLTTTTNVIVRKEWNDGLTGQGGITVTLYRANTAWKDSAKPTAAELEASDKIETVTLSSLNDWSYQWTELANLKDDGTRYYYYVREDSVPIGYVATYEKSGSTSTQVTTITNTPETKPGELTVQKAWDKVSDASKTEITLDLYRRKKALTTEKYDIPDNISVLCWGDSITQGTMNNVTDVTYPKELAKALGIEESKVKNCGVDGNTNDNIKARIESTNISFSNVDVVCLLAGTNDVLHAGNANAPEKFEDLVKAIFTKASQDGNENLKVYVGTIPYITAVEWFWQPEKPSDQAGANQYVDNYNNAIKAKVASLQQQNYDITLVDINSVVAVLDENKNALDKSESMLTEDGCHPNADGYRAIAQAFYKAIGKSYVSSELAVTDNTLTNIDYVPVFDEDYELFRTITLNSDNGWKAKLENLKNTFTENGFEYQWIYYVKEQDSSGDWEVSYLHNGQPANGQMAITVKNTGSEEVPKIPIKAQKVWKDEEGNPTNTHPDEVKVQLLSSTGNGSWTKVGDPVPLNASNSWQYEWKVEENLHYRVEEEKVTGWTVSYSPESLKLTKDSANAITVTNTLETGKLQVNKKWLGGSDKANVDEVEMEVYQVKVPSATKSEEAKTYSLPKGMLSLSRFRQAMAELETAQESEQETPQSETEEPIQEVAESDGLTLGSLNTGVLAKAAKPYVSLALNISATSDPIALPSDLKDKEITSVMAVFDTPNTNGQSFFLNFYDDGEWNDNKYTTISDLSVGEHEYKLDTTEYSTYKQVKVTVNYNNSGAVLKELRFYYTPQGPSITIDQSVNKNVVVGDTVDLPTTVSDAEVSWDVTSGNATIENDKIKFTGTGNVTVIATATDASGLTATASIDYTVSAFKINESGGSLQEGANNFTLTTNATGGTVIWESSNSNVLAVDQNGNVTVTGVGPATITATHGNATDTIEYTVVGKALTISADKQLLHVGNTVQLTATIDGATASGVTWTSSNEDVLTVDGSGKVTALKDGTATITATRNNVPATINIEVAPLQIVANNGNTTSLKQTANIEEELKIEFVNAIGNVSGTSNAPPEVATVDGTTIKVGTQEKKEVTITFRDEAGGEAEVVITVNEIKEAVPEIPSDAKVVKTLTISKTDNWQSVVLNLPITDGMGNNYKYYVKEKTDDSTKQKYTPVSYKHLQGVVLSNEKTVEEVTNKTEEEETPVKLPGTGGYGTRPYTIIGVNLMAISVAIWYIKRKIRRIQHRGA